MKLSILSVIILLTISSLGFGQGESQTAPAAKCTLALAQAPALRGLRLGMNQAQVLARFPGLSVDRADQLGLSRVQLTLIDVDIYPKGSSRDRGVQAVDAATTAEGRSFTAESSRFPDFKGVRKIQLRFVDGRVSYLLVGYDNSFKWNSVDEFAQTVSRNLGLPGDWRIPADSDRIDREKQLSCEGFLIAAAVGADVSDSRIGAQLSLEDTVMTRTIEKRQNDLEEKKRREEADRRKAFKP